ncbi:GTPase [Blastococcus brunescens]|uniref:GTPase n=1 Tax=Blastococcus brunescens TaxID=1564165 RepID=A0ABZ1AZA6_9ACTN|nr:GTPase [Blastococcus sp. BMG 8361]WRL63875.1 GTPase [Blastococcus sp. BMG 8361]
MVTWYRHGAVPRVALHPVEGVWRPLPVHRVDGALQLDLGGTAPEDVERLVVDWPTAGLAAATLIDTPGISSLSVGVSDRAWALLGEEQLPSADAVVFLTRQMQPEDLAFLARFQEATGGAGVHTTTITVLSRADEVGAGRIDALLAAEKVARRTSEDPAVRALSQAVVPVAGLVGLAGRMLRHRDFVALRSLATADRADLDAMLLTADRFCRVEAPVPVSRDLRVTLLERLGLFGIRLAVALIRTGVSDTGALSDQLFRRSGLAELHRLLAVHFTRRSAALRAATAVRLVERLLRQRPLPAAADLMVQVERIQVGSQELVELDLLARSRAMHGPFPWRSGPRPSGCSVQRGRTGGPAGPAGGRHGRAAARSRDGSPRPVADTGRGPAGRAGHRGCVRRPAPVLRMGARNSRRAGLRCGVRAARPVTSGRTG